MPLECLLVKNIRNIRADKLTAANAKLGSSWNLPQILR